MAPHLLGELLDLVDPGAAGAGEPRLQPEPRLRAAAGLEHVAQALLEQVGPVQGLVLPGHPLERLALGLGEVLGVLEQRVPAALDRLGPSGRELAAPLGGPGPPPGLLAQLVDDVGHPAHDVEGVHDPLGVGAVGLRELRYPARAVGRHHPYAGPLILAELLEEGLEHGLPVPLRAPDHAVGVVVEHDRHVLVALLVRSLVDADADQAVEAVPGLGIELVVDAPAYAADARPVDAHELGRGGLGGPACEPGDLLLELAREAGGVLGPGHGCDDDPVLGALDPDRGVLDEGHHGALVNRPPPPGGRRAVVDGAVPAAVGADVALALARAAGGDDGAVDLLPDGFYDSGAEAQRLFEYPLVLHGGGLSGPLPGPLSEVDFLDTKTLPAAPCIYLGLFTCPVFGSNPQKHPKSHFYLLFQVSPV